VTGGWRKLHNEECHNLYSSPNIRVNKSRRIRWTGHVVHMGRQMLTEFRLKSLKGRDHSEDLGINGRIILKCILGKRCGLYSSASV
jgi:hypothetical protein